MQKCFDPYGNFFFINGLFFFFWRRSGLFWHIGTGASARLVHPSLCGVDGTSLGNDPFALFGVRGGTFFLCGLICRRPALSSFRSLPLHRMSLPLHRRSLPLHRRSLPLHRRSLSLHRRSLPLHGRSLPLHGRSLPLHRRPLPLHRRSLPLHRRSLPLHGRSLPLHGMSLPLHGRSLPLYVRSLPLHGRSLPLHGRSLPLHGRSLTLHWRSLITLRFIFRHCRHRAQGDLGILFVSSPCKVIRRQGPSFGTAVWMLHRSSILFFHGGTSFFVKFSLSLSFRYHEIGGCR